MLIGIVLSQPPAYSETFFNAKIKGLQELGYEVILFVQSNERNYELCKVKTGLRWSSNPFKNLIACVTLIGIVVLNIYPLWNFAKLEKSSDKSWKQVFKNIFTNGHILSARLDWLHFGFATLAIESENVAKAIGAKMGLSIRGFDMDVYPLKNPGCYDLIWPKLNKIHTISDYLITRAYELGLRKQTSVQKIYPAVNLDYFQALKSRELNPKPVKFLTIARLHWIKGLIETLEACAILKSKGVEFEYTIIGSGVLYESLRFAIHQLNLKNEVILVGEKVHDDVLNYLKNTDLYIQYSQSEGFNNAVLEAQAMGVLCVVSDGGGLPENVIDKKTGWVVPKRQPEGLALQIIDVLNLSFKEKEAIRNEARDRIEEHFSLVQQKISFKEFYEKN